IIPNDLVVSLLQECDSKGLSSNTSPRAETNAGKASEGIRDGARFPSSQNASMFYFTPRVKSLRRPVKSQGGKPQVSPTQIVGRLELQRSKLDAAGEGGLFTGPEFGAGA